MWILELKGLTTTTKYMYLQILEGNLAHDPLNLINYLQISLFLRKQRRKH